MKKRAKYACVAAAVPLLLFATVGYMQHYEGAAGRPGADTLLLLLPDDLDARTPAVQEWLDAASEEGLHLQPIHDSEFLNPLSTLHSAGIILPDQLHRSANDVLIGELHRYVRGGGNLMVVYDACTWDLNGRFPPGASRLSDLVGVQYALYDLYTTETMQPAQVTGTMAAMRELGIPPGSFSPIDNHGRLGLWHAVSEAEGADTRSAFATYLYGAVDYPVFRTVGNFDGTVLLKSKYALAAGYRHEDLGQVLFVNLPLGYLASRTDGLLLHSFLHFFAFRMLRLPYLTSVPDGVGGLVFNWHIDAKNSLRPLETLVNEGVFDRGRFSVHFTAGPDVDAFGDHKGLDVLHDPEAQKLIHYLLARKDEIGSHGGWIHNYFGYHVNDNDAAEFQKYLELNKDALEKVTGTHVTEYSAPIGNHPAWVTRWLEHHGIIAYYFTGDAGLGPTRVYRDGERDAADIWAFPILHMGKEASLEEMSFDDVPIDAVRDWLLAVTEYTARRHTARLVYTHPYGAEKFFPTLRTWLDNADALEKEGRFRWYTMTDLAEFMTQREFIHWSLLRDSSDEVTLVASHPKTLAHQTWAFSVERYSRPRVIKGHASFQVQDGLILVTATDGRELEVQLQQKNDLRDTRSAPIEAKR
jgi:peptidoglycan/xylan/chitin deacetylase (PgdA/CDA1 family)